MAGSRVTAGKQVKLYMNKRTVLVCTLVWSIGIASNYAVEVLGSVGVFSFCSVLYFCGLFCFLISEKEGGGRKKIRGTVCTLGWIDTHSSLVGPPAVFCRRSNGCSVFRLHYPFMWRRKTQCLGISRKKQVLMHVRSFPPTLRVSSVTIESGALGYFGCAEPFVSCLQC